MDEFHRWTPIDILIHGGAQGADVMAAEWAWKRHVHTAPVLALWGTHGKKAGPIRNRMMLLLQPDRVIAFPGGKGTRNMMEQARNAGIELFQV